MTWNIAQKDDIYKIEAGFLSKQFKEIEKYFEMDGLFIENENLLEHAAPILRVKFYLAVPDEEPKGIEPVENGHLIKQRNKDKDGTDGLEIEEKDSNNETLQDIIWEPICSFEDLASSEDQFVLSFPTENKNLKCNQWVMNIRVLNHNILTGVNIDIHHEIYDDYPAIRKWITIQNQSDHWIKIDNLSLEPICIKEEFKNCVDLTPSERGAPSSIIAFEHESNRRGVILCSEIPSALRSMSEHGEMGYESDNFEWVLGPGESFNSEAVFIYAYQGDVFKTTSAVSKPLDRTIETEFKDFLREKVGVRAVPEKMPVPLWCTWSNFAAKINHIIIKEQAEIAARCGFKGFQIDAGWSASADPADWTSGSRTPHELKFTDFSKTCNYILSKGLDLGLWLSCFRNDESPDLTEIPEGMMYPKVRRGNCFGMSYASDWRNYYAKDVVHLHEKYGATYFKQDLTNIKFGDIAHGHENRTRKESLLRGLRGFFSTQDYIHENAPDVCTLLSHELYWGTPGTPCDLAAIKHCWSFHIPPNDYSGAFPRKKRITRKKTFLKGNKWLLLLGCHNARQRFYAHRGLPLYCIENYGAATVNKDGSLTPKIQDRQICSWLMGIPSVYAGDLSSLTEENIQHYRKRLDLIRSLQDAYNIYGYFQFSGVPRPTDKGWHWWGKINPKFDSGIVVVMRGFFGASRKRINIPWVSRNNKYEVKLLFSEKRLGIFAGDTLQDGKMKIKLKRLSQEIIEIKQVTGKIS